MRRLSAQDARGMAALHAESFAPPFGSGGWDALEMAAHVSKDICLGLDQNDALSAFIILSSAAGEAEILTLATLKSARRKGLGLQILKESEQLLVKQAVSELFLEVAEDNVPAISLYKKAGFTPIGRRPAYYRRESGRVAAITFSKKL